MKNQKGITLVALSITIIVILILASIGTYAALDTIQSSRLTVFKTELELMQTKVNELYEESKENQEVLNYGENIDNKAKEILNIVKNTIGITDSDINQFKHYKASFVENDLKLGRMNQEFLVNIAKRSVVSYNGIQYKGQTYYALQQIPNTLYNVKYQDKNSSEGEKVKFNLTQDRLEDRRWRVNIVDIQKQNSTGYVEEWQVRYKIKGKEYWNTTKDMNFVVTTPGVYQVQLFNDEIESSIKEITITYVNEPIFNTGMEKIMFDNNNVINESNQNFKKYNWYDYVPGDNVNDTKNSKWANARTSDGSYWVWIPRFAYKITYKSSDKSQGGTIDVKFLVGTSDQYYDENGNLKTAQRINLIQQQIGDDPRKISEVDTTADYTVHPAFTNETNIDFLNGGWDKELTGIWVAKFEMSGENASGGNIQPGNVSSLSSSVKLVSKPGVSSWRNINAGNMYTVSYNYDRIKDSHLMKNSEWGAVAYLTHSQYGRNGKEISMNTNGSFYTGGNSGETYKTNTAQSSTGNITGIYDLSGGAYEIVAAYMANGNASLSTYGASFATLTKSTKYATVYPYDSSNDSNTNNYNKYKESATSRYGDAILETSSSGSGYSSWLGDRSTFPFGINPFFVRGGEFDSHGGAGLFCFGEYVGHTSSGVSFRVVLAF